MVELVEKRVRKRHVLKGLLISVSFLEEMMVISLCPSLPFLSHSM